MNEQLLLDLALEIGHRLAICGAETYRVEESACRILAAYGISAEAFAVPYSLTLSIETSDGNHMMRIRRIGTSENDLDAVERYSGLSRRICGEKPDPETALLWLKETDKSRRYHSPIVQYAGNFLGAAGFGWFYGGSLADGLCAGLCGLLGCAASRFFSRLSVNRFFSTIFTAFIMAMAAYSLSYLGIAGNPDATIIGALMSLVPGLLFTNAMRDMIFGDTNSGIIRFVQVLLIALSIALGTGTAWSLCNAVFGTPVAVANLSHSLIIMLLSCAVGCAGFAIFFNTHGPGMLLCILGGLLTWGCFVAIVSLGGSDPLAYLLASAFASLYAEIMARIRKFPAIAYLVVSTFPLLPGGGIYYTVYHAVQGDLDKFSLQGMDTLAIAGAMAVGILMISTVFRLFAARKASVLQLKKR